tara:strand:- start:12932 stop:13564 length:633 start_codon:yes stop_codon:yes gene_type:complete
MTFGFGGNQQPSASALSLGLPNNQQSLPMQNGFASGWGQQAPPGYNPYEQMGAGMIGAMGMNPAAELAPPSDLEVMAALIQTSVPVDRWLAGPNMEALVSLLYKVSALATVDVLKNVRIAETEDGNLSFDFSNFENAPTADSVTMESNNLKNAATMTRDQAMQQQQAILNTVQQNLMSGALNAAMANPGMMESVGTGMGSLFRGALGMRT